MTALTLAVTVPVYITGANITVDLPQPPEGYYWKASQPDLNENRWLLSIQDEHGNIIAEEQVLPSSRWSTIDQEDVEIAACYIIQDIL